MYSRSHANMTPGWSWCVGGEHTRATSTNSNNQRFALTVRDEEAGTDITRDIRGVGRSPRTEVTNTKRGVCIVRLRFV